MMFKETLNKVINEEFNRVDYLKWKRKNVSFRGMKEVGVENGGSSVLGDGLYTAALSNKSMAKSYGQVYFVVNAIPKHPKVFNTMNEWEVWFYNNLVFQYSKAQGKTFPDKRDFYSKTTVEDEMMKLGYDGVIIKGREYVNYKPENVRYYNNEEQLMQYYEMTHNIQETLNKIIEEELDNAFKCN